VKVYRLSFLSISLAALAVAQAPSRAPKVALVNIQDAMVATSDGQTANQQLEAEFAPKKAKIETEHKAIAALEDKLQQTNLSDDDRKKLGKELDDKTILVNLETDQDDADLAAAQKKVLAELGKRMVAVIADYAAHNGYAMVFDISSSQAPRLYAENATDITRQVVAAYESKYRK
jgi:Skp family chaperone for outer membrane proteins